MLNVVTSISGMLPLSSLRVVSFTRQHAESGLGNVAVNLDLIYASTGNLDRSALSSSCGEMLDEY